jgi:HAD superfamily hydrolase (TIGR01509 family)
VPARACLLDVYDTLVTLDFPRHAASLPARAGVPVDRWEAASRRIGPLANEGHLTMAEAFREILVDCGREPTPELVDALVELDHELLLGTVHVFDDVVPFLETLAERAVDVAIVSNCSENTRGLLEATGITDLVDALVLSCEIGVTKPAPTIYQAALDGLGVDPGDAVFVDDQRTFCSGAARLGIRAARILRHEFQPPPAAGEHVVRSLRDLEPWF